MTTVYTLSQFNVDSVQFNNSVDVAKLNFEFNKPIAWIWSRTGISSVWYH